MKYDFSFLRQSLVYNFLTHGNDLQNFANVCFLFENEQNLEVYLDHPEVTLKKVRKLFNHLVVIQYGQKVESLDDFDESSEALVLLPHKDGIKYDIFLFRATFS